MLERRDDWTTREMKFLVQDEFGVRYTIRGIRRILRSLSMKYGKPYPRDYRRPEDAENRLKREVKRALEDQKKVFVVFLNECMPRRIQKPEEYGFFGTGDHEEHNKV